MWNAAGRSELDFIDVKRKRVTHGPQLPAEIAGCMTFTRDGSKLALVLSGASSPTDIWVPERATGKLTQAVLTENRGTIPARS
jgi:hypothetical protein